jgi:hypothetical protein
MDDNMTNTHVKWLIPALFILPINVMSAGFVGGVPVEIMKSDYAYMHLTFIRLATPISAGNCNSGAGLVLHDANDSAKTGVSLALTALAAGKTFQCYVQSDNDCSTITGAVTTYPVCGYYPSIKN